MRGYIYILFFLLIHFVAFAQVDTLSLSELKELDVQVNSKDEFTRGAAEYNFDSITIAQNQQTTLADLLANEGGVFIKSYGIGNLATSSVRGASAQHTKVLWNGLDVSNPMLGQVDFSYFNVNSFDDISIQFGNTNGLHGSGTQGGIIRVNNSLNFDDIQELKMTINAGSFGSLSKSINYKVNSKSESTTITINQKNAINNFNYKVNGQKYEMENADLHSFGVNFSNGFKINKYQQITTQLWFQKNERGIPTGIGISSKNERLNNQFIRSSIRWDKFGIENDYNFKTAYFVEKLDYINPVSALYSYTTFKKWINEFEFIRKINDNNELILGTNFIYITANTKNYSTPPIRILNAYFIAYNSYLFNKNLIITPSIRKEFVNSFDVPFTGSVGVDYSVIKNIKVKGSVSKNYRIPTFNDLYFENLGNPNLKSEQGWSYELSTLYNSKIYSSRVTGYFNQYTNWISWQPQSNGQWQPQNKRVETRGIEFYNSVKIRKIFFKLSAAYTQSIDMDIDKQLIYVPLVTANSTLGYNAGNYFFSYSQQYVGERFITSDEAISLPFYTLGDIKINKKQKIAESIFNIGLEIKNVMNQSFQAVVNQPMPGRYYGVNVSIEFNNKNKKI